MDFLGIGLPELAVILALALIVVGPKRLPEAAAQIARAIKEVRRYSAGMTRELGEMVKDLEQEYEGLKGELKETGAELRRRVETVTGEIAGAAEDVHQKLQEATGQEKKETGQPSSEPVAGESTPVPPEPQTREES